MNVLSLFDGMSCGRIALERLGIKVDNYYASEIDKYAMKVSEANYPDIIQVGDVTELDTSTLPNIDLIMGGSPCQGFSFAGKQLAFDDPRSALFFEFVRCVKELKPKYFLLENVRMKKEYLDIISEHMGVEPIMINSALVSAQNRVRYYWTNIPGVEQPEQRGIVLRDILETNTSNEYLAGENLQKNYKGGNQLNPNYKSQANTIHDVDGKSGTICAGTHGYANGYVADVDPKYYLSEKAIAYMNRGSEKYTGTKTRAEHYIKHESEKSKTLTANMHKGVPYGVIAVDKPNQINPSKKASGKQPYMQDRVFHVDGKSHALTREFASRTNVGDEQEVYWRKLTPIECERLQTVPDNYTNHVSNTQRYKMLGNGWTVDVIAHILQNMEINHREC
jgi:DNA (cytosine-5)-methyltransferase 3A